MFPLGAFSVFSFPLKESNSVYLPELKDTSVRGVGERSWDQGSAPPIKAELQVSQDCNRSFREKGGFEERMGDCFDGRPPF